MGYNINIPDGGMKTMTNRTKKHILKTAKDSVNQKFEAKIEQMHEQVSILHTTEGHLDDNGLISHSSDTECLICTKIHKLNDDLREVQTEWKEWSQRAKKNKKKVGKRVEWTNQRDQAPVRTINNDALDNLRKSRKENTKAQVGVEWLYEGALVTKRGKTDMMIVTRIRGNTVECLKDGTTQWFRNVALRPANWLMED